MANQNKNVLNKKKKYNNKSKYANGNNGGRNSHYKNQFEERDEMRNNMQSADTEHKYNDVSWYAKNDHILRDAASFSYNNPLGTQIPFNSIYSGANFEGSYAVPGLYDLVFCPSYGRASDYSAPLNLAAQNIYSYVRYANSGSKNYDCNDLMLYLIAMDNVYMLWNYAKRMYGYSKMYSQKNRYMPAMYAYADGFTIGDLQSNASDFRTRLNILAAKISSFCVPAVMPLFIRHSWMVSNIYKDSENDKAQQYYFRPGYFYKYDETTDTNGGSLQLVTITNAGVPSTIPNAYESILNLIDIALTALSGSEDIGVMSGDILKAYGQDKLFKLSPVEVDYQIEPVYNEEVLNQIHNSTLINAITDVSSNTLKKFAITQVQSTAQPYLLFDPIFPNEQIIQNGAFINMPWNEVSPENTMVGTRLTASTDQRPDKTRGFSGLGSEWINQRYIISYGANGGLQYTQLGNNIILSNSVGANELKLFSSISNFDWHPLMPMLLQSGSGSTTSYYFAGMFGDIDNYTIIDNFNLSNLHLTAIMSEFNIPQIGSF